MRKSGGFDKLPKKYSERAITRFFFEQCPFSFPKTDAERLEQNEKRSISSYVENIFTETPNEKFDVSVNIFSTYDEIRVF